MTKLYYSGTAADRGREDYAWSVPGQQPKAAERVDIPNNPAELAAWLNARSVPAAMPAGIAVGDYGGIAHSQDRLGEISNPDAAGASPPTPPEQVTIGTNTPPTKAERAVQMNDLLAIEEWIFDAAPWQVEQVFTALGARYHEMRKATQCPES